MIHSLNSDRSEMVKANGQTANVLANGQAQNSQKYVLYVAVQYVGQVAQGQKSLLFFRKYGKCALWKSAVD